MSADASNAPKKLVLVHLSDIHFHFKKGAAGGDAVLDEDIRRELQRDVVEVVRGLGQAHGILVTGDVAFAGRLEEYQAADKWLAGLCIDTKCDSENIWVVCGNHDVQRDIIKNSKLMQVFQSDLRACAAGEIDNKLLCRLRLASRGRRPEAEGHRIF
jgi:predicted MPP superfamily phosphohydrolase